MTARSQPLARVAPVLALHALAATALLLAGFVGPLEAGAFARPPTNPVPLSIAGDAEACQFAIMADNNIGEDAWILFSESEMWPRATFRNRDYFETMSDRRLSPGERLNVRYEVAGRCGATRNWRMVVRIGPRGGEKIQIRRRTNDPSDRTIHLGEAACWAMAGTAPEALDADRVVEDDDEAAGCDPETTRYGLAPEPDEPVEDEPPAGETDDPAADRPAEKVDVDQFQGNWVRVESNNPRNNGMRIRVEGDRATITAMPPRGSSRLRVGQVVWDDLSDDGSLGVRGSDGALYPSRLTMEGSNRLQLDIDLENSPGNDQTWERGGPSIDGDWVLYYMESGSSLDRTSEEHNWGLRVRVEGDRATIRYVPPTADRGYRVGDIIWREFSPSDHSTAALYSFESLFGGSTYEPARMSASTHYKDGGISSIRTENEASTRLQLWGRPEVAEEAIAKRVGEDEDEGALLGLPHEPVDDPSAQDPDLEPSEDMKTVDTPEDPTPAVREPEEEKACLATSLRHDQMGTSWSWGLTTPPPSSELPVSATSAWPQSTRDQYELGTVLPRYEGTIPRYDMVVDVERSRVPGLDDHHSYIWRANVGNRLWEDQRDLTASEFEARNESYRDEGFRLSDVEGYSTSEGVQYAGVWVQNTEGIEWLSDFDLTSSEYGSVYSERREAGYRLVDVEAYSTSNGIRYAGIWYRSCDDTNWRQWRNMARGQYQARVDSLSSLGFRVVDIESYRTSRGQRYAAIWEELPTSRAWRVRSGRTLTQFLNYHHRYLDEGFRLVDYESYETSEGVRYAGVWAENDSRYEYEARTTLNDTIADYLDVNELPGMSVVIIQDGDVIYRRGFGFAERERQRWAHSRTVYLTASVSKVIGATLAAKLEADLEALDLSKRTSEYLVPASDYIDGGDAMAATCSSLASTSPSPWFCDGLPSHHTHTLEELLSKTSCVPHYREGIEPDQSKIYRWRGEALAQIWNDPLLANCTPGQRYRYSTHGFTYVGGVLEAVTGKDIAQLLQDEIARPLNLSSMRAMYTNDGSDGFPVNYDRAKAYRLVNTNRNRPSPGPFNPTVRTEYSPNASWKVLGGGIEAHALDLARFGWKLLDGEIVSETVRNGRLWTSLTDTATSWVDPSTLPPSTPSTLPGGGVGMAWILGGSMSSTNGRSVRHGGTSVGAGSYLKIWRDRDLVIAMLSNRSLHDNLSRNGLLDRLADIVLNSTPP